MSSASDFWWEDEEKDQSLDLMLPCPMDQREEKTSSVFSRRKTFPADSGWSWPDKRDPAYGNRPILGKGS